MVVVREKRNRRKYAKRQTVELFLDLFPSVVFALLMLVYFILNLRREMKKEMDALRKKIQDLQEDVFSKRY